ncbi:alpha/beta hydrolase [bacterium]|nr:alpha/beta hydrolase [bacterium]
MIRCRRRDPRLALLPALLLLGAALPAFADDPAPAAPGGADPAARAREIVEGRGEFEMVLIHGLGANATVWDDVLPFLKNTFRVAVFEFAGHGATQPIADDTIAKESERLREFIAEHDFVYPTLVGHGMGGMIAMQYALDHPADVHRLIVIDAAPKQLATQAEKAAVGEQLLGNYDRFVAARYLQMSGDEAISQRAMDMALRTDSATFISLLMSSFDFDLTGRLNTLSVPLLVIGSEMMFPPADSSRHLLHHYGFSHARSLSFKRIAKAGHYVMLEQPVMTASVLLAFGVTADYQFDQ